MMLPDHQPELHVIERIHPLIMLIAEVLRQHLTSPATRQVSGLY